MNANYPDSRVGLSSVYPRAKLRKAKQQGTYSLLTRSVVFWAIFSALSLGIILAIAFIPNWNITLAFFGFVFFVGLGILFYAKTTDEYKAWKIAREEGLGLEGEDFLRIYLEKLPAHELVKTYQHAQDAGLNLKFEDIKQFNRKGIPLDNLITILSWSKQGEIELNEAYFLNYMLSRKNSVDLLDVFHIALQMKLPTNFETLAFLHTQDIKLPPEQRAQKGRMQEHIETLISYIGADPGQKENYYDLIQDYRYSNKLTTIIKAMERCNQYNIQWSRDEIKRYSGDPLKMINTYLKAKQKGVDVTIQDLVKIEAAVGAGNLESEIDRATKEQEKNIGPFTTYTADDQPVKITITLTYRNNLHYALTGKELKSLTHKIKEAYTAEIGNTRYERLFGRITDISRKVRERHYDAKTRVEFVELAITELNVTSIYESPHKLEKANYDRAVNEAIAEKIKTAADAENRKARARISDMEARIKKARAIYEEKQLGADNDNGGDDNKDD